MEKNININFGGLCSLLTIAFIVLKLCGVIAWSWFWVLSPIIFTSIISLVCIILGVILLIIRKE